MTTWTTPRTWNVGELVSKTILDTHVRDNLLHLKEQVTANLSSLTALINAKVAVVKRQGGNASNWQVAGTTNYTPATAKIQVGTINVGSISTSAGGTLVYGDATITFPEAFTAIPLVICSPTTFSSFNFISVASLNVLTTGCGIRVIGSATFSNQNISWIAIGIG